ncbi:MAG: cytochrome P450 [Caldilineaceae bacterium]
MNAVMTTNELWATQRQPINIARREFRANPFPFYAWLREEHPVYKARMGRTDVWLVTRYDDVVAVLKDERFVKNQANIKQPSQRKSAQWVPGFLKPLTTNMLDQDDPNHARLRALVHKAFTPARVEEMSANIQQIVGTLLDRATTRTSMDLVNDFALQVPLTVISELMGVVEGDRLRFHRWVKAMLQPPSDLLTLLAIPTFWRAIRFLRQLIVERRAHPGDDLLSALVQAEEAGERLDEDELLGMAMILLIAGYETTVNLIASGTLALLQNPEQMTLLRAEPALMRSAIEEIVRFTDPVSEATERYASQEVTLAGVTIPSGGLTLAVLASANRDKHCFEQPDSFDIRRQKNRHLGFGHGIHYCVGAPLARLEGSIALNALLQRLPNLQLAVPAEKLRWRSTPMLRGLESLPVTF